MASHDFRALFESAPGLFLVLLPDAPRFTIVTASDEYLHATMTVRNDIAGKGLFEVFPDNPSDPDATGTKNLRASLDRVLRLRRADAMAVQKYDIRRPESEGGSFEERFWSPLNAPVFDAGGKVTCIIHRVEDVTNFIRLKQAGAEQDRQNAELRIRTEQMEAEIFVRGQQLQTANEQLRFANEQLALVGETHFRALFDAMPQLGWTARPDGFIDFYNRRWYSYTGTTFEEMQGWGWRAVHDPAMLPKVTAAWQHALENGVPFEMEFPLRRHDGVFRWFLTRGLPMRDGQARIVRWVGINTDIHDRRQAGSASEARLRLLIDSIRDYAMFMLDTQGHIATWSPGAQRIKQYTAEEIVGRHFSIFYPEEDNRAGKPEMELRVASQVGRFEDEGWRVRKDGSRFWANVVISAVRDEDGALVGFSKVTRDLTDRKRAEDERLKLGIAQASEERARILAEASDVLSSSLDYETTLETLARLVVPRFGDWCSIELLAEEGTIENVAMAHADPSKIELARELQRRWPTNLDSPTGTPKVLRTGQSDLYAEIPDELLVAATRDAEHLRLARELRLRSAVLVPIIARGKTIGALSLVWAETPRSYTAADLPLFEELARRAGIAIENARLYLEAQNAIQLRDEFLSIASHELRTPLTSMQLQLDGVQRALRKSDTINRAKISERVEVIDKQLERLTLLVAGLLDVGRAAAGRLTLDLAEVELGSVIRDAVERLGSDLEKAACTVSMELEDDIVGRWDRMRLDQVVTNFLTNAVKYGAGKPITIRATKTERGTALFSVRDEGIGIPASDHKRIFDRFGRAVSAENYGGLGLGLWIVKECVAAMGGTVTVDSEPGRGSIFATELPLDRHDEQSSSTDLH